MGGATALDLVIKHPELVRKLIVSSASFHPDGDRQENRHAVGELTVEMIAGTPMEQEYLAKSPHPDKLQDLLDKLGTFDEGFTGWSDADIEGIAAPILITVGDCDAVKLDDARLGSCSRVAATSTATDQPGTTARGGRAARDVPPLLRS